MTFPILSTNDGSVRIAMTRTAMATGTGTQDITIPGFGTPKAARVIVTRATTDAAQALDSEMSVGVTDGTTQCVVAGYAQTGVSTMVTNRRAKTGDIAGVSKSGSWVLRASATLIANGIRLSYAVNDNVQRLVTVQLFGGTGLSAYVTTATLATLNNTITITPGFETNAMFITSPRGAFSDAQSANFVASYGYATYDGTVRAACMHWGHINGGSQVNLQMRVRGGSVYTEPNDGQGHATMQNVTSTNFQLRSNDGDLSSFAVGVLCLNMPNTPVWSGVADGPAATGSFTFSNPGFRPAFAELILNRAAADNTLYVNTNANNLGFGSMTAAQRFANSVMDDDNAATSKAESLSAAKAILIEQNDGTKILDGTLTQMAATGPQVNMTTVLDATRKLPMMAIGIK